MTPIHLELALATALLVLALPAGAESPPAAADEEAAALLQRARARLALPSEPGPAFRFTGTVQFAFDDQAPPGRFAFSWLSPDRWRLEMALPGWRQLEIRDGETTWVWRAPENDERAVLLLARDVWLAIDPVRLFACSEAGGVRRREEAGRSIATLELDKPCSAEVDLDEVSAELLAWRGSATDFQFAGERVVGTHHRPSLVRVARNGSPLALIRTSEPELAPADLGEATLVPPEGASRRVYGHHERLDPPRLIESPAPKYPAELARRGMEGLVVLRGIVGTDGRMHELEVLSSTHPRMSVSAYEAAAQRRYSPGRLDGELIEVFTTIRIEFSVTGSKLRHPFPLKRGGESDGLRR